MRDRIDQMFAEMREKEKAAAANHKRSVVINQIERVKVGLQEDGVDDDTMEDFETLETIIEKLMEEAWDQ